MDQLKILTQEAAPPAAQPLLGATAAKFGFVPNLIGAMANAPSTLAGYLALAQQFDGCTLSPVEQQVVTITVSRYHECGYCIAGHSMLAAGAGIGQADLDALREGRTLPTPRLEALRQFTRTMVSERGRVSRDDLHAFLAAGYTRAQALEVVLGVAFKVTSNYSHRLLAVPVDREFSDFAWSPVEPAPPVHVLVLGWVKPGASELLRQYQSAAGPFMKKYGGKPVMRASAAAAVVGEKPDVAVVMEFPSEAAASGAFEDPGYKELVSLRSSVFSRLEVHQLAAA